MAAGFERAVFDLSLLVVVVVVVVVAVGGNACSRAKRERKRACWPAPSRRLCHQSVLCDTSDKNVFDPCARARTNNKTSCMGRGIPLGLVCCVSLRGFSLGGMNVYE